MKFTSAEVGTATTKGTFQPKIHSTCGNVSGDSGMRGHSMVYMHKGYLVVTTARDSGKDGGAIEVYDLSNPRAPRLISGGKTCSSATRNLRENHWFGFWHDTNTNRDYVAQPSETGFMIVDVTDPRAPALFQQYALAGVGPLGSGDMDYLDGTWWVTWQPPYIIAAASQNGIFVVEAKTGTQVNGTYPLQLTATPVAGYKPFGFRTNVVHAVGNLMVVGASNTAGFATVDFTDPLHPQAIRSLSSAPGSDRTYSYLLAGKMGDPSKLYAYTHGLRVFELTNWKSNVIDDYDFVSSQSGIQDWPGISISNTTKMGYFTFQDGYLHTGFSDRYYKIDVRDNHNPALVRIGQQNAGEPTPDEDFATVLGNMVFVGSDHEDSGSVFYAHDMNPDTKGPEVTYITPTNNEIGLSPSTRVGVIFSDAIDMSSVCGTVTDATYCPSASFIVRPVGGAALAGKYGVSMHTVNFAPNTPFAAGTYEVVLPAGGIRDWSGNTIVNTTGVVSTFTVGNVVDIVGCDIGSDSVAYTGAPISYTATGCTGGSGLTYSWDFGDDLNGSGSSVSHSYAGPRHYDVILTVTNAQGSTKRFSRRQTVVNRPTWDDPAYGNKSPTRASPLVHDDTRTPNRLHVVNPDGNRVRSFDVTVLKDAQPARDGAGVTLAGTWETTVGKNPRTLALRPQANGEVWVACQDEGSIRVLDGTTGAHVTGAGFNGVIFLPPGSRPYGVAFSPDGSAAYVTLEGSGQLLKIDPTTYSFDKVNDVLDVGPRPRGLAVSADGSRILVTRFVSDGVKGEVRLVNASDFVTSPHPAPSVIAIQAEDNLTGVDSESGGRGVPNYLQSVTISPDGQLAAVPSKKDNTFRGFTKDGRPLNFENTVRTVVSIINFGSGYATIPTTDTLDYRRDVNNADMANTVVYTKYGDWAFVATHNNQVLIYDGLNYNSDGQLDFDVDGLTPEGLAYAEYGSGASFTRRLYVWSFMSRTISTYDVGNVNSMAMSQVANYPKISTVDTQSFGSEALSAAVLAGKKIFYDSSNPKMSQDGYIACASCHLEGGADETVFDFTDGGEGLRNTIALVGRRGMGHGPVHWSANFDEIQDFEHPIRKLFKGQGFMDDALFNSGGRDTPLGSPKAGSSADLDNLAAYVASLKTVPRSPYRNPNGTLTAAGAAGKLVFDALDCSDCHAGRDFTDSAALSRHDVGTIRADGKSGYRLGGTLDGIDTPTLLGIWNTAPYLHDGSKTLAQVLDNPTHMGATLTSTDKANLLAYLQQIDDLGRDLEVSGLEVADTQANKDATVLQGDLAAGDAAFGDRTYTWSAIPAALDGALWLRTAADSKNATSDPLYTFTVDKQTDVYVALDSRVVTAPAWLAAFSTATGTLSMRESSTITRTLTLRKKTYDAGSVVTLGPCVECATFLMYGVMLVPTPAGALPDVPIGLAAVAGNGQVALSWMPSANANTYNIKRSLAPTGPFTVVASGVTANTFVNRELVNNTTYYYVVSAVNSLGESANSSPAVPGRPTCTPPAAPTGLVAAGDAGLASVAWNAVANVLQYNVKRSTTANGTYSLVKSPSTNRYDDLNLPAGSYYYKVTAVDSCGESTEAGPVVAVTTAPSSKTVLFVAHDWNTTTTGIQLTTGDTLIKGKLEGLGFTVAVVADTACTSADATGKQLIVISRSVLSANVTNKYNTSTVPAINNEGLINPDMRLSASSSTPTGQVKAKILNSASALAGGYDVDVTLTTSVINFNAGTGALGAGVDKAIVAINDNNVALSYGYDQGAAMVSGTAPARRVGFFLDDPGDGVSPSTADSVAPVGWDLFAAAVNWATKNDSATTPPTAPTNLSASAVSGRVDLTWNVSAKTTSYEVWKSTTKGSGYTFLQQTTSNSASDGGVVDNKTYYYVVLARNAAGASGFSNEAKATPGCVAPAVPGSVAATVNADGTVTVNWGASAGASGYNVKRGLSPGGPYEIVGANVTSTSFDAAADIGTAYYFVVSSLSACESANSAQAFANPSLWSSQDIGAVAATGSFADNSGLTGTGTMTVTGSGADIWGTADEFRFVYQAITGDGSFVARVASVQNTDNFAKAGVMMRNTLTAGSEYVYAEASPVTTSPYKLQRRTTAGGAPVAEDSATPTAVPVWVKLTRAGNTFTGARSTDGSTWTALGTAQTITMGATIFVGLAVTSHNDGVLCTANFDSVAWTPAALPIPSFSPGAGTFTGPVTVTIGFAPGASVRYTTNGTTPSSTVGTLYTGPITIGATTTLKAIAFKTGQLDSPVKTGTFTISAAPVTVAPSHDAFVRDGTNAALNYGTAATLEVKNNATVNNNRVTYIRFPISALAGTVSLAKLRLHGAAVTTAKALSVYSVANITSWTEGSLTWNNAPPSGTTKLKTVTVTTTSQYWEWDVTAYVASERAAGHSEVAFAVKADAQSSESQTSFASKEATANPPQLVVTP